MLVKNVESKFCPENLPDYMQNYTVLPYEAETFQWEFFNAHNRFPAFIAGWGSGKTAWALFKGIQLSQEYDNNLGLVVRSKYKDLSKSTMKDFTKYTGLTIPQGTKEVKVANSTIMFMHAKELSGLQNVNLGWFYMEQAEEFPTDIQFMLLRGRLRRVLTPKSEIQERLTKIISEYTGRPALKEVVDNWQLLSKRALNKDGKEFYHPELKDNPHIPEKDKYMKERDIAELALVNKLGITLRQGMVIANASGHNWCWKKFIKSPEEEYSCVQATGFDNAHNLPADTLIDWERIRKEKPATYQQYIMNSHSEVDLEAAYYITAINEARKDGRLGRVPYDPAGRVHTVWDLGMDCTAIGFVQTVGQEVHIINYYENTGKPISHYAGILDDKKRKYKYAYDTAFMPPDANKREMQTGLTLTKAIKDLGYKVKILEREISVDVGINRVLDMFPRLWIDEEKCEDLIIALEHYRREYDEERKVYIEKPLHDYASHPADMIRYLSKAVKGGGVGRKSSVTLDMIKRWTGKYRRTG